MRLERNRSKSDINFSYTNDNDNVVSTVEKYVDMSARYPYTYKTLEGALKEKIPTIPYFNSKNLASYCKVNKIYENNEYYYVHKEGSATFKKYSKEFLDLLLIQLQNDINMFSNYK